MSDNDKEFTENQEDTRSVASNNNDDALSVTTEDELNKEFNKDLQLLIYYEKKLEELPKLKENTLLLAKVKNCIQEFTGCVNEESGNKLKCQKRNLETLTKVDRYLNPEEIQETVNAPSSAEKETFTQLKAYLNNNKVDDTSKRQENKAVSKTFINQMREKFEKPSLSSGNSSTVQHQPSRNPEGQVRQNASIRKPSSKGRKSLTGIFNSIKRKPKNRLKRLINALAKGEDLKTTLKQLLPKKEREQAALLLFITEKHPKGEGLKKKYKRFDKLIYRAQKHKFEKEFAEILGELRTAQDPKNPDNQKLQQAKERLRIWIQYSYPKEPARKQEELLLYIVRNAKELGDGKNFLNEFQNNPAYQTKVRAKGKLLRFISLLQQGKSVNQIFGNLHTNNQHKILQRFIDKKSEKDLTSLCKYENLSKLLLEAEKEYFSNALDKMKDKDEKVFKKKLIDFLYRFYELNIGDVRGGALKTFISNRSKEEIQKFISDVLKNENNPKEYFINCIKKSPLLERVVYEMMKPSKSKKRKEEITKIVFIALEDKHNNPKECNQIAKVLAKRIYNKYKEQPKDLLEFESLKAFFIDVKKQLKLERTENNKATGVLATTPTEENPSKNEQPVATTPYFTAFRKSSKHNTINLANKTSSKKSNRDNLPGGAKVRSSGSGKGY